MQRLFQQAPSAPRVVPIDRRLIVAVLLVEAALLPWMAHAYDASAFLSHADGVFFAHIPAAALWPYGSLSLGALLLSQLPVLFVPQLWTALPFRITLLKLPAWLAEIGTAAIVRACAAMRSDADLWALRYLADPAVVFVTVFHGQNDALPNFFAVAGIALMLTQRFELAGVAFGLGAGTKFYPAAFVPLLLVSALRNGSPGRSVRAAGLFVVTSALTLAPVLWGRAGSVFASFRNNSFGAGGATVSTASLWTLLPHQNASLLPQIEQIVGLAVPVVLALAHLGRAPSRRELARTAMLSAMSIVLLNPGAHPPFYLWIAGPLVLYAAIAEDWVVSLGGIALSWVAVMTQFCQEGSDEYLRLNFGTSAHSPLPGCVAPAIWTSSATLLITVFVVAAAYRRELPAAATHARLKAIARFSTLGAFAFFAGAIAIATATSARHFDGSGFRDEVSRTNTFALLPARERLGDRCKLTYSGEDVIIYAGNAYAARFATASLGYTLFAPSEVFIGDRRFAVSSFPSTYENIDVQTTGQQTMRITREFNVSAVLRPYRSIETLMEQPCTLVPGNPLLLYRFDFAAAAAAAQKLPLSQRLGF